MKAAIVYDRVNKWGGAERVLLTLHELFPDAPLYTSVYHPKKAAWAKVFPEVIPSFLGKIPFVQSHHEFLGALMPIAFESFRFDKYDLVISVTSEAAKGIITKPSSLHICYCLTPTRYLWSHYNHYFKGLTFKSIIKPIVYYLRKWDKIAAQRPDVMVGISTEVCKRIKKYYERKPEIIFPPVNLEKFKAGTKKTRSVGTFYSPHGFYLIVSRLVPYKRIDLAIEAFNELRLPLVIVGTGSEEYRLKKMAKENIHFIGFIDDALLLEYYQMAKALIMPQEEDFGIVAVEAQAAGCPVIAYKKGGVLDSVVDGKTGILFSPQTKNSLIKAVKRFNNLHWNQKDCIKNAKRFSKERFKKKFKTLIEKHIGGHLQ